MAMGRVTVTCLLLAAITGVHADLKVWSHSDSDLDDTTLAMPAMSGLRVSGAPQRSVVAAAKPEKNEWIERERAKWTKGGRPWYDWRDAGTGRPTGKEISLPRFNLKSEAKEYKPPKERPSLYSQGIMGKPDPNKRTQFNSFGVPRGVIARKPPVDPQGYIYDPNGKLANSFFEPDPQRWSLVSNEAAMSWGNYKSPEYKPSLYSQGIRGKPSYKPPKAGPTLYSQGIMGKPTPRPKSNPFRRVGKAAAAQPQAAAAQPELLLESEVQGNLLDSVVPGLFAFSFLVLVAVGFKRLRGFQSPAQGSQEPLVQAVA